MSDIFISYSSKDRPWVRLLAEALRSEGFSSWWDRTTPTGANYYRSIEDALNAARCVVVVWSPESVRSDWVPAEAQEGLTKKILIPILHESCNPPLVFRHLQTVDLRGWSGDRGHEGYQLLVRDIAQLLGHPPLPAAGDRAKKATNKSTTLRSVAAIGLTVLGLSVVGYLGFRAFTPHTEPAVLTAAAEIVAFSVNPSTLNGPGAVTLTWLTRNASEVRLEPLGAVPASGEKTLQADKATSYTLTAIDSSGHSESRSVEVRVAAVAPPTAPQQDTPTVGPAKPEDREQRRDEAQRLAGKWVAGWFGADIDALATLSSEPFFSLGGIGEIFLTQDDFKAMVRRELIGRGKAETFRRDGVAVTAIRALTLEELEATPQHLLDRISDGIRASLRPNLAEDFVAIVTLRANGSETEGFGLLIQRREGRLQVVGVIG